MTVVIHDFSRLARSTKDLLERQREGIVEAKKQGKYKGRKEVKVDNFEEYYNKYMNRQINKTQLAKELGVSRSTLDKLIEKCEGK